MRTATIALLLCSLLFVHEAQAWVPIIPTWHWSAQVVARRLIWAYGASPWFHWIILDNSFGENWNLFYQRHTRFTVFFRVRQNFFPYKWFGCRARMCWPKGVFLPWLETPLGTFWNKCWPLP